MNERQNEIFSKLLEESFRKEKSLEPGAKLEAIVTEEKGDYIFIKVPEINLNGILDANEFESTPEKGSTIEVYFLQENHGDFIFTSAILPESINKRSLEMAQRHGIPVWGVFQPERQGGFDIKIGEFQAFCPFSQVDPETRKNLKPGAKQKFLIQELGGRGQIVVSQKQLVEKEKEAKKEILREELKEGSFVTCTVKSIQPFGVFVDMDGFQALIPASEATYKRNANLSNLFSPGDTLRARILNLNWAEDKISLTVKDFLQDPWAEKAAFGEGDIRTGTIESIKPFGIFVRLDENFVGLVPNRETGLDRREQPNQHFHPGEKLDVFIMEVNPQKRQISLSIRKARETKDRMDYKEYLSDAEEIHTSSFGNILKKALEK